MRVVGESWARRSESSRRQLMIVGAAVGLILPHCSKSCCGAVDEIVTAPGRV